MTKIACLGWGSLVWRPESLLIKNKWFEDGPLLPIEFSRQSDNGRITLIIDKSAKPVRTLWTLMTVPDLFSAIQSLKEREDAKKIETILSVKSTDKDDDEIKSIIIHWLQLQNLDAAIWTGLSYSKWTDHKKPTVEYIISHLNGLEYEKRQIAEEYIRKAPKQIDTEYRRIIEREFGWTFLE